MQYSTYNYNKICIRFREAVEFNMLGTNWDGGEEKIKTVCNNIPQSDYSRENYVDSGSTGGLEAGETTEGTTINQI